MQYTSNGNNAWLYQKKFFHDFEWSNRREEKESTSFFDKRLEWLKNVRLNNDYKPVGQNHIDLTTEYPGLITGIGVKHETGAIGELKLGFNFDYTTGMPIINGHSVKGALRAAFPQRRLKNSRYKDEKAYQIHCFINEEETTEAGFNQFKSDKAASRKIDLIEQEIFDGKKDGKLLSLYKQDTFFDATIIKESQFRSTQNQYLGDDYITHHPSTTIEPNPVRFLKVLPGIGFRFYFQLHDGILTIKDKENLFTKILLANGIGAKTSVGYGQFKI